ncbi:MAG TPA: fumarylacetoacetate hydrolase family protein [Candidatus Dormibacteraeota bacterium]|jgi:2-keto-4-pentenoate hydratase/2-oxohepta-3-ene-1,7-dioic acid hydratase in catechol pathway|nr:fumarylacetoacetate hydrolase family protein [Candidatus Dormibacteraeota bacterium]
MRFLRYTAADGERIGIEEAEGVFDLTQAWLERTGRRPHMLEVLAAQATAAQLLTAESGRSSLWRQSVALRAPIGPGKIIGIGRNYSGHATEQDLDPTLEPVMFAKFPSSVIGPGDAIVRPAFVTQLDFEAELGVVIGRRARKVEVKDALGYVGAYTCLNDVSARDLQFADKVGDKQWVRGKSLDTFCPLGPALVTPDEVVDPARLKVECHLNGVVVQSASTGELIFDIPFLISYLSQMFTLEPGDVIATGTPGGVGHFRTPPLYMKGGDEVSVTIERLGTLTNPIVDE